ncbi:MAG: citrate lyase beta subunit, partial [Candidatus Nanosalina sp. J07AB43]
GPKDSLSANKSVAQSIGLMIRIVTGSSVDTIIIPKANGAEDVYAVEKVLDALEDKYRHGLEPQIESGEALHNVMQIAESSERNESLIFGPGDFSASTGIPGLSIGSSVEYDGHRWHHALAEINAAAKACGLDCIDGPFADVEDVDGYRDSARNARGIGCDGKWAVHPSQIPVANEVFAPDQETVKEAREVLDSYSEASENGKGAIQVNGKLVDEATIKMAENVVEKHEEIEDRR